MAILNLKHFFLNFATTFMRQVLVGLIGIASLAIIARVYGPEGNGIYTIAILLPYLLTTLLNLGIASSNVYFIGSNQVGIREVVKVSFKIFIRLSFIGLIIGGIIIWRKGSTFFPSVSEDLLWLALLIYPIFILSGFVLSIFHGLQRFDQYNKFLVLQPLLFFCSLIVLYFIGLKRLDYLILFHLLSHLFALFIMLRSVYKLYHQSDDSAVNTQYQHKALAYGWKSNLSNILGFLNYKADIFLVNLFLNPLAAGIYVISVTLAEKLWIISGSVSTVLLPRLSQLSSDEKTRKALTPIISRFVLWLTALISVVLAIIAKPLIEILFGQAYEKSLMPLLILLPGIIILGVARVWANDIAARGKPEINMYIASITLMSNLLGNIVLIPKFGLIGAASATTIAYFIASIITLIVYSKLTHNPLLCSILLSKQDMKLLSQIFKRNGSQQ